MPTDDTQLQIARKVNFAIQLLREALKLLEAQKKSTPTRRTCYPRRSQADE
jgi:hypothetical protein